MFYGNLINWEGEWGKYPKYNDSLEVRSSAKIILTEWVLWSLFKRNFPGNLNEAIPMVEI